MQLILETYSIGTNMLEKAKALSDQLVAWRREIHMYPELGFAETRTANLVAETLEGMGIEAQTGVGKTGVVGYLGDSDGPVIGIRADMDALPIHEENDVPYASQSPGLMHACGHDAHTAMLLGVAKLLSEMPDRPRGQVRFLFQPSEERSDEENISGAPRMIEDGALKEVDAVIALHVASEAPSGMVMIGPGHTTAASDEFTIKIFGTGGHGAYPHQTTDPTFMLSHLINAIYGICARRINPTQAAVISIGSIHGGTVSNVIPSEIEIMGTMRSYDKEVREQLREELTQAVKVVEAFGGKAELKLIPGYMATYNDPGIAEMIQEAATDLLGKEMLLPAKAGMGAEDFSYMADVAPGAMFMLGAKYDETDRPHHTPVFDINEACLPVGAAMLAETTVRLLRKHAAA